MKLTAKIKNVSLFRTEFKTKRDCKKVSQIMGGYNIASSILAVILFAIYVVYTVNQTSTSSLNGFHKIAVETTRQVNEYIDVQKENLADMLYFVATERLSKDAAIEGLSYNDFLEGDIMFLNPSTYVGEIVLSKRENHNKNVSMKIDVSDNSILKQLCDDAMHSSVDEEDYENFEITDVFESPVNGENAFALCHLVRCEDGEYLFCYIMNTASVLDQIARNSILIDRGILIDTECNLLGGTLAYESIDCTPVNLSECQSELTFDEENRKKELEQTEAFLDILKQKDSDKRIQKRISTEDCGIFILKGNRRIDNIYIYVKIESLGDWY